MDRIDTIARFFQLGLYLIGLPLFLVGLVLNNVVMRVTGTAIVLVCAVGLIALLTVLVLGKNHP